MKLKLFTLLFCLAFSINAFAIEKFTLTWEGGVNKWIVVYTTPEEEFTVDWGDGNVETFTGFWDFVFMFYDYPDNKEYQVTVTGLTDDCQFEIIQCDQGKVSAIDVSECPSVDLLSVNDNLLTELNLENKPLLRNLDCGNNLFNTLDVRSFPKLERLFCTNLQLTELDVSLSPLLEYLDCSNNLLTELDLSANSHLGYLLCNDNLLSDLDLSANPIELADCFNNRLPLSVLYHISENIEDAPNKRLGTQNLSKITVETNTAIDFSDQEKFGETATEFVVLISGESATIDEDYTIQDGIIIFLKEGVYTVEMTNAAIISDPEFPAEVIVEIEVNKENSIFDSNISKIMVYPNPTTGIIYIETETVPELKLYTQNGKLLRTVYSNEIDMTNYAQGIYFLKINDKTQKIVKK